MKVVAAAAVTPSNLPMNMATLASNDVAAVRRAQPGPYRARHLGSRSILMRHRPRRMAKTQTPLHQQMMNKRAVPHAAQSVGKDKKTHRQRSRMTGDDGRVVTTAIEITARVARRVVTREDIGRQQQRRQRLQTRRHGAAGGGS
jgi:hypothetical protein